MTPVRFPGEDAGRSLAEMAQRDLDAALQLLANRAQYITGATGAAIALRRDGRNDMLCRASTGTNAPELGALLSTEFGLSGESVRTKRALRCDDAERDARVNREVCRQLGIASVVVMPVVHDDHVLGVFELFSGKAHAFGERDLSAVQRLSEMVEMAVRLANAGDTFSAVEKSKTADGKFVADVMVESPAELWKPAVEAALEAPAERAVEPPPMHEKAAGPALEPRPTATTSADVTTKKPLFWSAEGTVEAESSKVTDGASSNVPPMLRGLKKCEACGFPVSAGRVLCVECEEKKWRGQLRPQAGASSVVESVKSGSNSLAAAAPAKAASPAAQNLATSGSPAAAKPSPTTEIAPKPEPAQALNQAPVESKVPEPSTPPDSAEVAVPEFVLSAAVAPSQSWLGRNKYVLGVLIVIAAIAVVVYLLR